jgi:hypothetical protein
MPYGDGYTSLPPDGYGEPYEYVYYPSMGWTWVVAPWMWGIGPWPHFGVYGAVHFGWYGHGWWRSPWRWHYRPGFGGSFAFHGVRPAPNRGFSPFTGGHDFRGGPAFHGAPAFRGGGHFGGGGHSGGHR